MLRQPCDCCRPMHQRIHDLSELMIRLCSEMRMSHLVDRHKFPEFSHLLPLTNSEESFHDQPSNRHFSQPSYASDSHEPYSHKFQGNSTTSSLRPVSSSMNMSTDDSEIFPRTSASPIQSLNGNLGLVAWIATAHGKEKWVNPVDAGIIQVQASSFKRGHPRDVCEVQFTDQIFYTDNIPYSWVSINFGYYRIRPTRYTFAHRAHMDKFYMRNWEFQASQDGTHWITLKKHVNDLSLCRDNLIGCWTLENSQKLDFFKMVRVIIDAHGNSEKTSALVISCFEIFGDVMIQMS